MFRYTLFTCLIILSTTANSQDSLNFQTDRFSFSVGGFYTSLENTVVIGIDQLGLGLSLELEDALGLESSALVLRAQGDYTFGKRRNKMLSLGYIGLLRKAKRQLGRDLEIGDFIYPLKTEIETKFNLEIYKLAYNWGFFKDDRMRLGIGGGVFIMPIGFSISSGTNESDFFQFIAPLPSLGVTTDFYIGPRWTFSQSLDIFFIQFSSFKGSLTDLNLKFEYRPLNHFAIGTGLNTFRLNIETKDDLFLNLDFKGSVESSYTGLLFYAKYLIKYKD